MPKWKAGDRVKIAKRPLREDDHLNGLYYEHMAGLPGTVTNVYGDEIAVKIDPQAFDSLLFDVHTGAVKRMRAKFRDSLSDEQWRKLTPEEKRFDANYVLLVSAKDLEKGPPAPKPQKKKAEDDEDYDGTSVVQGALYDDASIPEIPRRKTTKDIAKAEEDELKRRRN